MGMKKAGILVGSVLILLAVVIFWLSKSLGSSSEPKTGGADAPPVSHTIAPQPQTGEADAPSVSHMVASQPQSGGTDGNVVDAPSKTFLELDESQLGEPVLTKTEIFVVADKKVIVLDGAVGTKLNKQLVYSVGLLDSSNNAKFSLYLNKAGYDTLNIGDRVKVQYYVFKNDVGTEFPAVISAERVMTSEENAE